MREWQVGDPIGDGNDIGVPDTRYMDYLREDEEEDELLDEFRFYYNQANGEFMAKNYDLAFNFLKDSFEIYQDLNQKQKRELSENPFNHFFVVELLSAIYNRHDERHSAVNKIIEVQKLNLISCDCGNIYPESHERCCNCGKSFNKREYFEGKIRMQLTEVLTGIVYDKQAISELVERIVILIESNNCRLIEIDEIDFMNIHFIFEKEHEYFTTRYICLFCQENHDLRIFEDFEVRHDHTKLLQNERFQKSIKDTERKTGFKFRECDGGYGARLDKNRFDFIFTDDVDVIARFDIDSTHFAVFDVDLDNMELSKDHMDYERNVF